MTTSTANNSCCSFNSTALTTAEIDSEAPRIVRALKRFVLKPLLTKKSWGGKGKLIFQGHRQMLALNLLWAARGWVRARKQSIRLENLPEELTSRGSGRKWSKHCWSSAPRNGSQGKDDPKGPHPHCTHPKTQGKERMPHPLPHRPGPSPSILCPLLPVGPMLWREALGLSVPHRVLHLPWCGQRC